MNTTAVMLGAVGLSIITWLTVSMQNDFIAVETIPVVLSNLPEGKALRYPVPSSIVLRVRGSGWRIAELMFSHETEYAVNLAALGRGTELITRANVLEFASLPPDVDVIDVQPDTLWLGLTTYREKRVPVNARISLEVREGYGVTGEIRVDPESVTVGGSLELIAPISAWNTQYRGFSDVRLAVDEILPLERMPEQGVTISSPSVRVRADIQPFAEKTVGGIVVRVVGAPPGREVVILPPALSVVVRGSIERLSAIRPSDFSAAVQFGSLEFDTTGVAVPRVASPPGVTAIKTIPAEFRYVIRRGVR